MYQKLSALLVALLLAVAASAAVDVNTADATTLEAVKGIGPATAKAIVAERAANGPFKDFADLAARIKGIGDRKIAQLKELGVTVGGAEGAEPATAPTHGRKDH